MTEEQRYRESIQIEKDKVQLLKRIAVAVETIAAGFKMQELEVFEADTNKLSDEDVERLVVDQRQKALDDFRKFGKDDF